MNPNVPLQEMKVKMTSPPKSSIFEVKRESFSKKIPRCDSPKLLTKMKPLKRAKVETLLRLTKPEARNSPVKPRNFNLVLESREQTSHVNLTSAVRNTPSLGPEADSQSEKILQNPQKIKPGISHPIGQKFLWKRVDWEIQPITLDLRKFAGKFEKIEKIEKK